MEVYGILSWYYFGFSSPITDDFNFVLFIYFFFIFILICGISHSLFVFIFFFSIWWLMSLYIFLAVYIYFFFAFPSSKIDSISWFFELLSSAWMNVIYRNWLVTIRYCHKPIVWFNFWFPPSYNMLIGFHGPSQFYLFIFYRVKSKKEYDLATGLLFFFNGI